MYRPKYEKEYRCPLEKGIAVFAGKWKPRIICLLSHYEKLRYAEVKRRMPNLTDAVLSSALNELINEEIVTRYQYNEVPLRVEYSLSDKGSSLVKILQEICQWSRQYCYTEPLDLLDHCKDCEYYDMS